MDQKQQDESPNIIYLTIYGIWSKEERNIIFVSLDKEEVEMDYDMEGYGEDTHAIICLQTGYVINASGSSDS